MVVRLTINPLGGVDDCVVTASSGSARLDEAACNGSKRFALFSPALNSEGDATTGAYPVQITYRPPAWPSEEPEFSREAAPRDQKVWAGKIANNFPMINIRRPLIGTVGIQVLVGENGRVLLCEVNEPSGESILDVAACRSMFRYARFEPALDIEGYPTRAIWRTSITYKVGHQNPSKARAAQPVQIAEWTKQIAADYPEEAKANNWGGTVGISVIVSIDGLVESCAVTSSTGHSVLDAAACIGAKKYARFEPALNASGEPTRGIYSTRVTYRLPDSVKEQQQDVVDRELPPPIAVYQTNDPVPIDSRPLPPPPAAPRFVPARVIDQAGLAQKVSANYPARAIRREIEGTVSFVLVITPTGGVGSCVVTGSSGYDILDEAACNSLRRYARFEPARSASGEPISGTYRSRVSYSLQGDPPSVTALAAPIDREAWVRRILEDLPDDAWSNGWERPVRLRISVDESGNGSGCYVAQSSGNAALDQAACTGVYTHARFTPQLDGEGQPTWGYYETYIEYEDR